MSAASITGLYTTTCRLCNLKISKPPLELPIIGRATKPAEELFKVLIKHLALKHPEEFAQGAVLAAEVPAFFTLAAFHSEDPSLTARIENVRAGIFALVRKNSMQDAMVEHIVASLGLDPQDAAKVNEAMKALRDACCEFGQFAPNTPNLPKSLIHTV